MRDNKNINVKATREDVDNGFNTHDNTVVNKDKSSIGADNWCSKFNGGSKGGRKVQDGPVNMFTVHHTHVKRDTL